jgi:hypothetical protein
LRGRLPYNPEPMLLEVVLIELEVLSSSAEYLRFEDIEDNTEDGRIGVVGGIFASSSLLSGSPLGTAAVSTKSGDRVVSLLGSLVAVGGICPSPEALLGPL